MLLNIFIYYIKNRINDIIKNTIPKIMVKRLITSSNPLSLAC